MILVIILLTNISRQGAYQSLQMISFPVRLYTDYNTIKCLNEDLEIVCKVNMIMICFITSAGSQSIVNCYQIVD